MTDQVPQGPGRTRRTNVITTVVLALTAVLACVFLVLALPYATGTADAQRDAAPTLFVFPTDTPTLAGPTAAINNAAAQSAVTPTAADAMPEPAEPTELPDLGPSDVATEDVASTATEVVPTATDIPPTSTPEPSPTVASFAYVLRSGTVEYYPNPVENSGCNWIGVSGEVYNAEGSSVQGVRVHLSGGGTEAATLSGSNQFYGISGWEIQLGDEPMAGTFTVQLEAEAGEPISEAVVFDTQDNCDSNMAHMVFEEQP
jgi:hypothetical protein